MCFSATASFIAGGTLAATGIVSLKKVENKSQFMFGAIPLLFGIQQISEGFLWLALQQASFANWQKELSYIFLFFAQALWTTWIPLSFYLLEKQQNRKNYFLPITMMGIGASLMLGYRLLFYPITVEIMEHHIFYEIESPQWIVVASSICYLVAIIFPPFVSSIKGTTTMGILLALSLIVTKLFFDAYLISVWCFFAALLSVTVIYVLRHLNERVGLKNKGHKTAYGFNDKRSGLPSH